MPRFLWATGRKTKLTRQLLTEDDRTQHSSEHEVRGRVDHTHANGTACQRQGAGKETPHHSVKGEVHEEEELLASQFDDVEISLRSNRTYTSAHIFHDDALIFYAERVGYCSCPGGRQLRGGELREDSVEGCAASAGDGVEQPLCSCLCHDIRLFYLYWADTVVLPICLPSFDGAEQFRPMRLSQFATRYGAMHRRQVITGMVCLGKDEKLEYEIRTVSSILSAALM